jgi:hypothetical protein
MREIITVGWPYEKCAQPQAASLRLRVARRALRRRSWGPHHRDDSHHRAVASPVRSAMLRAALRKRGRGFQSYRPAVVIIRARVQSCDIVYRWSDLQARPQRRLASRLHARPASLRKVFSSIASPGAKLEFMRSHNTARRRNRSEAQGLIPPLPPPEGGGLFGRPCYGLQVLVVGPVGLVGLGTVLEQG